MYVNRIDNVFQSIFATSYTGKQVVWATLSQIWLIAASFIYANKEEKQIQKKINTFHVAI